MTVKAIAATIMIALAVSGCVSAEQRAANDDAFCKSIGAQPGTPSYVECRLRRDDQRAALIRSVTASGTVCNQVGTAVVCN